MPTYQPPFLPGSDLSREPTDHERETYRPVTRARSYRVRPDGSAGLGRYYVSPRYRLFSARPVLLPRSLAFVMRDALNGGGYSFNDCWHLWQQSPTIVFPHESFHTFAELIEGHGGPTLTQCDDCYSVINLDADEGLSVGDNMVCDSCADDYCTCDSCGAMARDITDVGPCCVCGRCLDRYWRYCSDCERYCHVDDDHHHGECDCEPIAPDFRFLGADVDEETTLSLPAGAIDERGLYDIAQLLNKNDVSGYLAYEIGNEWQGKRGTYTRRLSAAAHKVGKKIPADVLTQVGNIARSNCSVEPTPYLATFTRDTHGDASDFGNSGSCWFGDGKFGESRCALRSWGGFAFRVWSESVDRWGNRRVLGRCWVQPLKLEGTSLVPTQSIDNAKAFMTYNGYGQLEGYVPARLIAQSLGWTYRKITYVSDAMYVNGNMGYLISTQTICDDHPRVSINLDRHDVIDDCEVHHVA